MLCWTSRGKHPLPYLRNRRLPKPQQWKCLVLILFICTLCSSVARNVWMWIWAGTSILRLSSARSVELNSTDPTERVILHQKGKMNVKRHGFVCYQRLFSYVTKWLGKETNIYFNILRNWVKRSKRTLYPEVYILTAETNVIHHFTTIYSRVIALQRASESKAVVWDLNTIRHQSIQPVQRWNISNISVYSTSYTSVYYVYLNLIMFLLCV